MNNPETEPDDLLSPVQPERASDGASGGSEAEPDPQSDTATEAAHDDQDAHPDAEGEGGPHEREPLPEPEPEKPKAPKDPVRNLVRAAWAAVVVLVVLAALLVAGMLRISDQVNRVACIQRAQANYQATTGQGASAYAIGLARLAIRLSLAKCGQ